MHCQELDMNNGQYQDLLNFLKNEIDQRWTKRKIRDLQRQATNYRVKDDKLYYFKNDKLLKVVKDDQKEVILYMSHKHPLGGHFAKEATYNKILLTHYWKGMKKDIQEYIKNCEQCQMRGDKGGEEFLNPIKVTKAWEMIGMDFIGPIKRSRRGNKYILVITEYLTKWVEAKAMREATGEKVAEYLYKEIICRHGCPKVILSDRGTHFNNKVVQDLCNRFQIRQQLSSPYHPQTNGLTERFNRTLCETLAKSLENENQWDEYIESALFAYRTIKHSTTGQTPFYMMYGREALLPINEIEDFPEIKDNIEQEVLERRSELIKLEEKREEIKEVIENSQSKRKEKYDQKIKHVQFQEEEEVLLKDQQRTHKLSPKWKGPYLIHKNIGKGAYKLRNKEGQVMKAPQNVRRLKRFHRSHE